MIKRIFSVLVSLTLMSNAISFISVQALSIDEVYVSEETAQQEYDELIYSFVYGENAAAATSNLSIGMSETQVDYPSNYAGACYDANGSNKLDIYLTDDDVNEYLHILDYSTVEFHQVDYSMEDLLEAKDAVLPYMGEYNIISSALIQKDNTIEIIGDADFSITDFYELVDDLNIDANIFDVSIDEDLEITTTASTATGGSEVYTSINCATIGFNAYKSSTGQYGIVTAGHFLASLKPEKIIYVNGTVINSVGYSTYKFDGIDAAFIPFYSTSVWTSTSVSQSTSEYGFIKSIKYASSSLEGTAVKKYGVTTGVESGTILSISVNMTVNDEESGTSATITDMLKCSNKNMHGDSGGPIGIVSGSSSPYSMSLMAITTSMDTHYSDEEDNEIGYTYATKVTNIVGQLGVTVVTA